MKKFAPLASLVGLALSATPAFAQAAPAITLTTPTGFKIQDLGIFITQLAAVALIIAAILVFVFLVWGGIQWITSGGDKGKTEEARNRITAALVGLAIIAAAWAIVLLIQYLFGINVFGGSTPLPVLWQK